MRKACGVVSVAALMFGVATVLGHALATPAIAATEVQRTFIVTATDFAYTGLPARLPAGWVTIRMVNKGKELHMFANFEIPRGYTESTLVTAIEKGKIAPPPEWGGPNAVAPGDTTSVTLFLKPHDYMVGCFVVSPDGKPHFAKGMLGSFEVVPSSDTGSPPPSDKRVTLTTYRIAMNGGAVTPGAHMLLVHNSAKERHDFVILRVLPGHTVDQALAWFHDPPVGQPAAVPIAGTTSLHPDETAFLHARFTPGTYVLVCWLTTDKKYHFDLGMKKVITVSES